MSKKRLAPNQYIKTKLNNPLVFLMPGLNICLEYGLIYKPYGDSTLPRDMDFVGAFQDEGICDRVAQLMNRNIKEEHHV